MDGALCLWTLLAKVMADTPYVGILDINHVTECLWKVANASKEIEISDMFYELGVLDEEETDLSFAA